jgi:hypothetical protein
MQELHRMFTDYKISVIRIRGVEVNEVLKYLNVLTRKGKGTTQWILFLQKHSIILSQRLMILAFTYVIT